MGSTLDCPYAVIQELQWKSKDDATNDLIEKSLENGNAVKVWDDTDNCIINSWLLFHGICYKEWCDQAQ